MCRASAMLQLPAGSAADTGGEQVRAHVTQHAPQLLSLLTPSGDADSEEGAEAAAQPSTADYILEWELSAVRQPACRRQLAMPQEAWLTPLHADPALGAIACCTPGRQEGDLSRAPGQPAARAWPQHTGRQVPRPAMRPQARTAMLPAAVSTQFLCQLRLCSWGTCS